MAKRARRSYSPEKRAQILAAAKKERLSAPEVQKRFGVKPVTYYSWRKKTGVAGADLVVSTMEDGIWYSLNAGRARADAALESAMGSH